MSILLLAVVVGAFAGLNGIKTGWMGVGAALIGLMVKSAFSVTWVYWGMGFILIGCTVAAMASIMFKNRALQEIILGVQRAKEYLDPTKPGSSIDPQSALISELSVAQSRPTKKLVQYQKLYMKLKGQIT